VACALVGLSAGCQGYSTDYSTPVAIEIVTVQHPPLTVEERDTLHVRVLVLDRGGDSVPGAAVRLLSFNPDTLAVDSATFGLDGVRPGTGRVVAIAGNLQSAPLVIKVVRAPDSLKASGPTAVTVVEIDTLSAPLSVQLLDLRTDTTHAIGITWGDTVHFAIVYPVFAGQPDTTATLRNDSLTAAVITDPTGTASVQVKRNGSPQPDSVVVEASARRANGAAVGGSPIQFVVHFQ
jgi:hypothetical protein